MDLFICSSGEFRNFAVELKKCLESIGLEFLNLGNLVLFFPPLIMGDSC